MRLHERVGVVCVASLNVNDGGTAGDCVFIDEDSAALVGAKILTFGLVEVGPSAPAEIPHSDSPNWDPGGGNGTGLTVIRVVLRDDLVPGGDALVREAGGSFPNYSRNLLTLLPLNSRGS